MEKETRTCDTCKKTLEKRLVDFSQDNHWICLFCTFAEYKNNFELITQKHTNEENALVVEDYPYGWKKTKIKYWIETTKKGDRFVSQTLNPKTLRWNKPKKSTYQDLMVLVRQKENNHVKTYSWSVVYSVLEDLQLFKEFTRGYSFNDLQLLKIKEGKAIYLTREFISVKIAYSGFVNKEQEQEQEQEQKRIKQNINTLYLKHLKEQE